MAPNVKLSTLTWVFTGFGAAIIIFIFAAAYLMLQNLSLINQSWKLYQTDLSQKSRLEVSLRTAIGYGGMVHNYKNYLLRGNEKYLRQAESQYGAATAFIEQYNALTLSPSEEVAINDISQVLAQYKTRLSTIESMIEEKATVLEIHQNAQLNDQPAIRGFEVLRHEIIANQQNQTRLTKSRILADIRAALGYDGMIHRFKDYVLNHTQQASDSKKNLELETAVSLKIKQAKDSISKYRQETLSVSEEQALNDIESTIDEYSRNLADITKFIKLNLEVTELDSKIKVNDDKALKAFKIIEKQINQDIINDSEKVGVAFDEIIKTMTITKYIGTISIFLITLLSIIVVRLYVIKPILKLTDNMVKLANNDLDIDTFDFDKTNAIGQMALTLKVFKQNLIRLIESEESSAKSNEKLRAQLAENKQLREQSEEQTSKALQMAEYMGEARNTAEKATAEAKKNALFVSSILNAVQDGIITIDSNGHIEAFNPGAESIFGYQSYEVIGKNVSMLMPEVNRHSHDQNIENFVDGKSTRNQSESLEQIALRKNGEPFPVEISLNTVRINDELKVTGVVRDITDRKQREAEIEYLAMTDSLTGLANRNQFSRRMDEMFKTAQRYNNAFCIMSLDLDNFKPVNDTYGHHIGDKLLQKVAHILQENCRETDTIARLGGDEFSILTNIADNPEELEALAQRLVDKLGETCEIDGHTINIGASIGISCYPTHASDNQILQINADKALYQVKNSGRNGYCIFSDHLLKSVVKPIN